MSSHTFKERIFHFYMSKMNWLSPKNKCMLALSFSSSTQLPKIHPITVNNSYKYIYIDIYQIYPEKRGWVEDEKKADTSKSQSLLYISENHFVFSHQPQRLPVHTDQQKENKREVRGWIRKRNKNNFFFFFFRRKLYCIDLSVQM